MVRLSNWTALQKPAFKRAPLTIRHHCVVIWKNNGRDLSKKIMNPANGLIMSLVVQRQTPTDSVSVF